MTWIPPEINKEKTPEITEEQKWTPPEVVKSSAKQKLPDTEDPPNRFEYLITKGIGKSVLGTAADFISYWNPATNPLLVSDMQRGGVREVFNSWQDKRNKESQWLESYDPNLADEVAAFAIGMVMDAPVFAGGGTAGRGMAKGANWAVKGLVKSGLKKEAAEQVVKSGVAKIAANAAQRMGSSAGALGVHGAASNLIHQIDKGTPIEEIEKGEIIKEGGKSALLGAGIGILGTGTAMAEKALLPKLVGKGDIAKYASLVGLKGAEFAGENALFLYGGQALESPEDRKAVTGEDWLKSVLQLGVLKLSGVTRYKTEVERIKAHERLNNMVLTKEELNSIEPGMSKESLIEKVKTEPDFIKNTIENKNVPITAKTKMVAAVSGVKDTPVADLLSAEQTKVEDTGEGTFLVKTLDKEGNLYEVKEFESQADAMKASIGINKKIEDRNFRNDFNSLTDAEISKMDTELRTKGFEDGVFTEKVKEALLKNPEELTPDEIKIVNSVKKNTSSLLQERETKAKEEEQKLAETEKKIATEEQIIPKTEEQKPVKEEVKISEEVKSLQKKKPTEGVSEQIKEEKEVKDAETTRRGTQEGGQEKGAIEGEGERLRVRESEKDRMEAEKRKKGEDVEEIKPKEKEDGKQRDDVGTDAGKKMQELQVQKQDEKGQAKRVDKGVEDIIKKPESSKEKGKAVQKKSEIVEGKISTKKDFLSEVKDEVSKKAIEGKSKRIVAKSQKKLDSEWKKSEKKKNKELDKEVTVELYDEVARTTKNYRVKRKADGTLVISSLAELDAKGRPKPLIRAEEGGRVGVIRKRITAEYNKKRAAELKKERDILEQKILKETESEIQSITAEYLKKRGEEAPRKPTEFSEEEGELSVLEGGKKQRPKLPSEEKIAEDKKRKAKLESDISSIKDKILQYKGDAEKSKETKYLKEQLREKEAELRAVTPSVVSEMTALKDEIRLWTRQVREGVKEERDAKKDIVKTIKDTLKDQKLDKLTRREVNTLLNKIDKSKPENLYESAMEAVMYVRDLKEQAVVKELDSKITTELEKPTVKKENKRAVGKTEIPVQIYVGKAKEVWEKAKGMMKSTKISKTAYTYGLKGEALKAKVKEYEAHKQATISLKENEFNQYVESELALARAKQESDIPAVKEEGIYQEIAIADIRRAFNADSKALTDIYENVKRTIDEGKSIYRDKIKADAERRVKIKEEAGGATRNEYTGLNEAEARKADATRSYKALRAAVSGADNAVKWAYKPIQTSLEFMLKHIESKEHRTESGPIYKRFFMSDSGWLAKRAERLRDKEAIEDGMIRKKFKEIVGGKFTALKIASLSERNQDTGIHIQKEINPFKLSREQLSKVESFGESILSKDASREALKKDIVDFLNELKISDTTQKRIISDLTSRIKDTSPKKIDNIANEAINILEGRDATSEIMSKADALYIYSALKMEGTAENYAEQGFDAKAIRQLEEYVGKDLMKFSDWVQDELLPTLHREKYDPKHREIYNSPLDYVLNYFPLKYDENGLINKSKDFSIGDFSFLMPSVTSNHIKSRIKNMHELSRSSNYFDVLFDYVESMERWYHYSELTRDFNTIISDKTFTSNVNRYDRGTLDDLINAFTRSTEQYKGKISREDKTIADFTRGVAAANITLRGWTALKQPVSAIAWLEKTGGWKSVPFVTKMLHNAANPVKNYLNHKFFLKESALYRERVKSRDAGYEDMRQGYMATKRAARDTGRNFSPSSVARYISMESQKLPTRIGMSPNVFLDLYTISSGGKAYYDQQVKMYSKTMSKSEAHKLAIRDFDLAFNQVQQSAEQAFIANVQANKTALKSFFTIYKTSQFSYMRKFMQGGTDLINGYKRTAEASKQKYINAGISPEKANAKSRRAGLNYLKSKDGFNDFKKMALYAYALPVAWQYVTQGMPGIITKWDEDDEAMMKRAMYLGPVDYLFIAGDLSKTMYDHFILGKQWFEWQPSVLVSEINTIIKDVDKALSESGDINPHVVREIIRAAITTRGIDIENLDLIYEGAEALILKGEWTKENWMKLLAAPKSFDYEAVGEAPGVKKPLPDIKRGGKKSASGQARKQPSPDIKRK